VQCYLGRSILKRFRNALKYLIFGRYYYDELTFDYHRLCFSQEGEDLLLFQRLLSDKKNGFYVDVGAHHPQRFSNTYKFYLSGWRGINIDPMPNIMTIFDKIRPRDINLELGIAGKDGRLAYYCFDEPALNTFDKDCALRRRLPIISTTDIRVRTLVDVFNEYIPPHQTIDFLTIDVEGLDLNVLKSNDWEYYRPTYVLAESLEMISIQDILNTELNLYMVSMGYRLISKLFNTVIFEDFSGKG
jgi:FkbM family methyltransferase